MIIHFSVENVLSFRETESFSMASTKESRFQEHLSELGGRKGRILPLSGIFGTNGAGKSNFVSVF